MTSHRMMLFRGFILFLLCLVAEDRCVVIADPFPERRRTADFGVRDELGLIERARFEADGANKQGSPALRELREELLERRAAIARDPFGVARHCAPPFQRVGGTRLYAYAQVTVGFQSLCIPSGLSFQIHACIS